MLLASPHPSASRSRSALDIHALLRRAHADHIPRAIRLRDGSALRGVITAVVGGTASEVRVKVVVEAPSRERRWFRLSEIRGIAEP